ncbi:MAG: hypothetical protein CO138_02040 [Candidatus Moranbacteria bacterium CG_4_9_14_3_um_filter_33_15]|nr:MAG: hypothetical protein CO138_02040 [Candidatus Moranbacteria bacterium CG_4_9_14_3_um_filter_33_15]
MENKFGEIKKEVQHPNPVSLDQELRIFNFHDNDGKKFEVVTKEVGNIDQVYEMLENNGEKKAIAPKELILIIDAFKNCAQLMKSRSGKEVRRSPHLLISGGFVRDILTGHIPRDIDLTTNLTSGEIYTLVKNLQGVKRVGIHGESSEVVRVKFNSGEEYEISSFKNFEGKNRTINPGEDAGARDFTANALFYSPLSGRIIDYVGGIKDIKEKRLKFTGSAEKRIEEDGIRMLRFVRFLFKTGFSPAGEDKAIIRVLASRLKNEATERIKNELDKILLLAPADSALGMLDELGLLEQIFPEVKALQNCEQRPPFHLEGNVFNHTMLVAKKLPLNANLRLKWAAIFHDIAKPETREETEKKGKRKVSFLKHDQLGAEKVGTILKRASFSNKEIEELKWLIANHQALFQQVSGRIKEAGSANLDRAKNRAKAVFKKMIMDKGIDLIEDLVCLSIADLGGQISEKDDGELDQKIIKEIFFETKKELEENKENGVDLKKLVNGKIIMETLKLKPGPEIGKIQKQVLDILLQSGENFSDEELAKKRIRELILKLKA